MEIEVALDNDFDRFWRVLHAYTLRRFRELLLRVTDLIVLAYVITLVSVDTAFHEHKKRKVKVKSLNLPLKLIPQTLHPVHAHASPVGS